MAAPSPVVAVPTAKRIGFAALLVFAMGVAIFTLAVLGILAPFIIDDLGITREQFGLLIMAGSVVGAVASPVVGAWTDRIGAKRAFITLLALSASAYLAYALSPFYSTLFLGSVIGGLSQSAANPPTNKLIAFHVGEGRRATVTGLKQSGVQLAIFIGGVAVPLLAIWLGWRGAFAVLALLPLLALPIAFWAVPPDPKKPDEASRAPGEGIAIPSFVFWLAGYGLLLGLSGSATFFIPLFVVEALDGSATLGGVAAALVGLAAFYGRIEWARRAESGSFTAVLGLIALLGIVGAGLMLVAIPLGFVAMWAGVIVIGLTSSSWNSVGMLAAIVEGGALVAGKATGIVLAGFLVGLGLGPPIYGRTVDITGGYELMWVASIMFQVVAVVLVLAWRRTRASI